MKSLIIGLGVAGQLYEKVLTELGSTVYTVDSNPVKNANYIDIKKALNDHSDFDTAHICTTDGTHHGIALNCKFYGTKKDSIIFVDNPGFRYAHEWKSCIGGSARFMLTKPHQYRDNINKIISSSENEDFIRISWMYFKNLPSEDNLKKMVLGGITRHIMPHLLSYVPMIRPNTYNNMKINGKSVWKHNDIDDYAQLSLEDDCSSITLTAAWQYYESDDFSIKIGGESFEEYDIKHDIAILSESAYLKMISNAIDNRANNEFWIDQSKQDLWIYSLVNSLDLEYQNNGCF